MPSDSIFRASSVELLTTQSESESFVTTDGQSASLSWNKAPIWGVLPVFITVRLLQVCYCGALSLTKGRVCRLQMLLALASAVILGSQSRGTRDHILLAQIQDFLLIASYDSQGYGGGIRPHLHMGSPNNWLCPLLTTPRHGPRRSSPFPTVTLLLRAYSLPRESDYRAVSQMRSFTESPRRLYDTAYSSFALSSVSRQRT
jgi:hypothetical protein